MPCQQTQPGEGQREMHVRKPPGRERMRCSGVAKKCHTQSVRGGMMGNLCEGGWGVVFRSKDQDL